MLRIAHHLKDDILWFELVDNNPNPLTTEELSKPTLIISHAPYTLYNVEGDDRINLGTIYTISELTDRIANFVKGYENAAARYKTTNPSG